MSGAHPGAVTGSRAAAPRDDSPLIEVTTPGTGPGLDTQEDQRASGSCHPPSGAWVDRGRAWRAWPEWRRPLPASPEVVARFAPLLVALRWGTLSLAVALGVIETTGAPRDPGRDRAGSLHAVADPLAHPLRPDRVADHRRSVPRGGLERGRHRSHRFRPLPLPRLPGRGHGHRRFRRRDPDRVLAGGPRRAGRGAAERAPRRTTGAWPARASSSPSRWSSSGWWGASAGIVIDDAGQAREGLTAQAEHLSEVNDLLLDLHRATAREPTPLDLDGAARWALERLEEMFTPDIGRRGPAGSRHRHWHLVAGKGVRVTGSRDLDGSAQGPGHARRCGTEPIALEALEQGLSFRSRWGLYCPLRARDELVGVLAVEWQGSHQVTAG